MLGVECGERREPVRDIIGDLVLAGGPAPYAAVIEAEHSGEAALRPRQEIKADAEFGWGHGGTPRRRLVQKSTGGSGGCIGETGARYCGCCGTYGC
jgi:hypothetical protein